MSCLQLLPDSFMHLFKNKTKDVKQFLGQMKANKTNRSSNMDPTNKRSNPPHTTSPSHHDQLHTSLVANLNNSSHHKDRRFTSSVDSNRSFDGSVNSNQRTTNPQGHKFFPSPPQPSSNQRISQEQMNFKNPGPRPFHNQSPQYSQAYGQHISQPSYHDHSYSNRLPSFQPAPKQFKPSFEQSKVYHQPVNNHHLSQSMIHHGNGHSNDFYEQRRNYESPQNFSQASNSTIYENPQFYQSNSMGFKSYQTPIKKSESSYMNQSSNHQVERKKSRDKSPKNQATTSQQLNNRFEYHKSFVSQVSNIDCPMEEIHEVEAGLSTEKDSPSKFSEYLSKSKNVYKEFTQNKVINFAESNVFEVIDDDFLPKKEEEKPQKINNIFNTFNGDRNNKQTINKKQPLQKITESIKDKQQHNLLQQPPIPSQNEAKTIRLKVTEDQRRILNKSFHQIQQAHETIDRLFKQTSILFNNIQRSSNQFNKRISEEGDYYKYISLSGQKSNRKMEIEKEEVKVEVEKVHVTYKKGKPKANPQVEHKMNAQRTYKKSHYNSDVEI